MPYADYETDLIGHLERKEVQAENNSTVDVVVLSETDADVAELWLVDGVQTTFKR